MMPLLLPPIATPPWEAETWREEAGRLRIVLTKKRAIAMTMHPIPTQSQIFTVSSICFGR
jgi:hypothetical protein